MARLIPVIVYITDKDQRPDGHRVQSNRKDWFRLNSFFGWQGLWISQSKGIKILPSFFLKIYASWHGIVLPFFAFNVPKRCFVVSISLNHCQVLSFPVISFVCIALPSWSEVAETKADVSLFVFEVSELGLVCVCVCAYVCACGCVWSFSCLCLGVFHFPPMCCLCLWSTGPPLHCSSASSSPVEQLLYPPPSIAANENQGGLLGNSAAQPAQDSDSEDEFGPNSFLVKTGSGNLYAPATATADGELVLNYCCFLEVSLPLLWICCVIGHADGCGLEYVPFFLSISTENWNFESICSLRVRTELSEAGSAEFSLTQRDGWFW